MPPAADPVAPRAAAVPPLTFTQAEAARYAGLSRSGWFRLKSAGLLPKPVHVPGVGVRYRRSDLERWAERLKPTP